VLITTKRGKAGKTSVSFNFQTGYSEATKRLDMLNSEEYAELILEGAAYRDNLAGIPINDPDSWTSYVKNDVMDYYSYGQWSADPLKSYDWQDAVFQKVLIVKPIFNFVAVVPTRSSSLRFSIWSKPEPLSETIWFVLPVV
jgi:hypothetical protein